MNDKIIIVSTPEEARKLNQERIEPKAKMDEFCQGPLGVPYEPPPTVGIKTIKIGGKTIGVSDKGVDSLIRNSGVDSLSDKLADLIESTTISKDEVLKEVFKDFTLKEVKEKGDCRALQDGSEIFSLDGVDLVQFWPPNIVMDTAESHTIIRIDQEYRRLKP